MSEHVDHVVVGGGVMGAAAAWQLARRGRQVVLLERFGRGHTRGASHGASRIYRNTYARAEYLDLVQEAFDLWRVLEDEAPAVGELLTITGGVSQGSLASREVADAFVARGIPHEWLSAADAHARWPGLAFEGDVLHETSTAGRLHADRAVEAFLQAAAAAGARVLHETPVRAVEQTGDGVRVVTDTGTWHATSVVVAVGAWTSGLLAGDPRAGRPAGGDPGAARALRAATGRARRRPVAVVHARPARPAPVAQRRLRPGRPRARASRSASTASARAPTPTGGPSRPSRDQLRQLRDYVAQWVPGADPDHLVPISCTYTTTPDHDFVLDRRGRVVVAAGFSGHGFKFAPAARTRARRPRVRARVRSAHPAFAAARFAALPA